LYSISLKLLSRQFQGNGVLDRDVEL